MSEFIEVPNRQPAIKSIIWVNRRYIQAFELYDDGSASMWVDGVHHSALSVSPDDGPRIQQQLSNPEKP